MEHLNKNIKSNNDLMSDIEDTVICNLRKSLGPIIYNMETNIERYKVLTDAVRTVAGISRYCYREC